MAKVQKSAAPKAASRVRKSLEKDAPDSGGVATAQRGDTVTAAAPKTASRVRKSLEEPPPDSGGAATAQRADGDATAQHGDAVTAAVSRSEIGAHPPAEDAVGLMKDIHLFGPSNLDRAIWCRQLATMIEMGVPLLQSLRILSKRTPHKRLADASRDIAHRIEEGSTFHEAVRAHEVDFTPLVCNIIRVGESAGILERSLIRLAQIMEAKADMNRRIFSAIMYPAVALATALIVVAVIMVKAVPVFMGVYGEAGQELPTPTRIVVHVSNFVRATLPLWIVGLVALGAFWMWFRRTPKGKAFSAEAALRTPVVGRIARKIGVARFARTTSSLLTAGVPLTECLRIAAETHENARIGRALHRTLDGLQRGERISRGLAREAIFPPLVIDMIAIGEETGSLDRTLEKLADIYEADVDATLRGLATIIEPVLIMFVGGLVVFIALAVMLPYFNLVSVV